MKVAASPPFLEDGILVSQPSPLGNALKLSGRTIFAPHRGSCPKGRGLAEGERERSQPPALRATSFQRKEGECRLTDFPRRRLTIRECRFPALSFRAKARNLFRLRSGKGCEDSGELEAPCFQRIGRTVFHADSITKENGNGKRKRSLGCARDDETRKRLFPFLFNLLRKPTPPRCARQPLPREGARVDTPSFLWKEVPRRGGGWMGEAVSPTQSLPRVGKVASEASRMGY